MKITRIGNDKDIRREVTTLDIELSPGKIFRLTDAFGGIRIHERGGHMLIITPCCSNEIVVLTGEKSI